MTKQTNSHRSPSQNTTPANPQHGEPSSFPFILTISLKNRAGVWQDVIAQSYQSEELAAKAALKIADNFFNSYPVLQQIQYLIEDRARNLVEKDLLKRESFT